VFEHFYPAYSTNNENITQGSSWKWLDFSQKQSNHILDDFRISMWLNGIVKMSWLSLSAISTNSKLT